VAAQGIASTTRQSNTTEDITQEDQAVADEVPGEEEFEFRLFNTSKAVTKIVLPDEQEELSHLGNGKFVVPSRPLSFYLAPKPSDQLQAEFEFSAVTGDEILERSRQRCWGLELPWRVTQITLAGSDKSGGLSGDIALKGAETGNLVDKRRRPSKKKRIAVRIKEKARLEKKAALEREKEAKQKESQDKEEYLREKKKRLNRQKKLKRRAKNKEEKEKERTPGSAAEREHDDDSSDDAD
jgi:hypothetical protein